MPAIADQQQQIGAVLDLGQRRGDPAELLQHVQVAVLRAAPGVIDALRRAGARAPSLRACRPHRCPGRRSAAGVAVAAAARLRPVLRRALPVCLRHAHRCGLPRSSPSRAKAARLRSQAPCTGRRLSPCASTIRSSHRRPQNGHVAVTAGIAAGGGRVKRFGGSSLTLPLRRCERAAPAVRTCSRALPESRRTPPLPSWERAGGGGKTRYPSEPRRNRLRSSRGAPTDHALSREGSRDSVPWRGGQLATRVATPPALWHTAGTAATRRANPADRRKKTQAPGHRPARVKLRQSLEASRT